LPPLSAIAHLAESLALAADMELPGEAWQLWTELASCYACAGDAQQAEAARLQAERGIAALASLISDAALKDSFLQSAFSRLPVHDQSIQ